MRRLVGRIRSDRDLRLFVLRGTLVAVTAALCLDIANQLLFFEGWPAALRSWLFTVLFAIIVAMPLFNLVGRAHREAETARAEAEAIGRTDPLTGLPNRRAMMELSETHLGTMVLAIVDIDRFKAVNDTYGHLAGDEVIRRVGRMMAAELGRYGPLCRIGGEEFALLSRDAPDEVVEALRLFRERIAAVPLLVGEAAVQVTLSAGVAVRRPGASFMEVFAEADRALYDAKRDGRNRIAFAPGAALRA
ncbi:GGDEF domain-containing protein [Prosthecomicrobium pneumaticum]|nr:GGDEF domain-containing protein [Prosthecomicrobium pneumaticum]